MSRKLNNEIVKKEVEMIGCILIGEYIPKQKIKIECKSGHKDELWVHRLKFRDECPICKKKRLIREEIESKNYRLINEYEDIETVLNLICSNGHERNCKINSFRNYECEQCASEEKMKYLIETIRNDGYHIISIPENTHGELEAICSNGHYRKAKIFNYINHKCSRCNEHRNYQYTYNDAKSAFEAKGFELISNEYINCKESLIYRCTCGEIGKTTLDTILNSDKYCCDKCKWVYISDQISGENHHAWNGGASSVATYVRNHILAWKKESIYANDYKCIISQESFDDLHHLYSFNYIFEEIKHSLPFSYKDEISDYYTEELKELEMVSLEIHRKYGYGVCLKSEIHNQFHSFYGRGNNDSIQFLSFVEDFYPESFPMVENFILEHCIK